MTHLISSSLQPSSIPTYRRAWKLYRNFLFSTVGNPSSDFPIPPATLALFIAHLYQQNYASSTVNTYVSCTGLFALAGGCFRTHQSIFYSRDVKRVWKG